MAPNEKLTELSGAGAAIWLYFGSFEIAGIVWLSSRESRPALIWG
jgi:hypothetical protein